MNKILSGAVTLAMLASAAPAFADINSSAIVVTASNSGSITNVTGSTANTGGNTAGGSKGGKGGSGGDVEGGAGDFNNGGAAAGEGGNGGDADEGGLVETGNANADAGSINKLNSNDVYVGGRHSDINSSAVVVTGANAGAIVDVTAAGANSGDNKAKGSKGGRGGRGGEVEADGSNNNGAATGGNGGQGGNGGLGGTVRTGEANSNAGSLNIMNTNIVRVRG